MGDYDKLLKIFKQEDIYDKELFKATLSAIGMMGTSYTKQNSIRIASKKYNIPQTKIKPLIEKMKVKSRRFNEQRNNPLFRECRMNEVRFNQKMSIEANATSP